MVDELSLLMRQHGPEAAQSLRRNAWPELWNVALQIGPYESLQPLETRRIVRGEKTVWKPAAHPKRLALRALRRKLALEQRSEFRVGDAPGERFR